MQAHIICSCSNLLRDCRCTGPRFESMRVGCNAVPREVLLHCAGHVRAPQMHGLCGQRLAPPVQGFVHERQLPQVHRHLACKVWIDRIVFTSIGKLLVEGVYVYCKAPGSSDTDAPDAPDWIDRMIFNHSVSEINGVYFSQQAETTAPSLHLVLCDAGRFGKVRARTHHLLRLSQQALTSQECCSLCSVPRAPSHSTRM